MNSSACAHALGRRPMPNHSCKRCLSAWGVPGAPSHLGSCGGRLGSRWMPNHLRVLGSVTAEFCLAKGVVFLKV